MINYELALKDDRWDRADITGLIERAIALMPEFLDITSAQELSLVLSNDDMIQTLNRDYRKKDKPTNVLSFPTHQAMGLIGDVVLSYDTIKREAQDSAKRFEDHVTHLIIHGVLHLFGYDHIDDKDAAKMEELEIAILAKLGIANPYIISDYTP